MAAKDKTQSTPDNGDGTAAVEEIINADPQSLRPSQRAVLDMLLWMENIATEDTGEVAGGFFGDDIAAILTAPDEATMLDADELPRFNAKVLSGCALELFGIDVKFSDSADIESGLIGPHNGRKMYVLVRAVRLGGGNGNTYKLPEVGEEMVWNTSARFIVAKLFWYANHGYFDNGRSVKVRIQGTKLDGQKTVEKIKALDSPAMAGTTTEAPF